MEKKNDFNLFSCDEGGRYDINTLLKWFFLNTVLVAFCFGWRYAVVTALSFIVVFVLSRLWYNQGRYENVVDEYEQEGYPRFGWEKLLKNWKALAFITFAVGFILFVSSKNIL